MCFMYRLVWHRNQVQGCVTTATNNYRRRHLARSTSSDHLFIMRSRYESLGGVDDTGRAGTIRHFLRLTGKSGFGSASTAEEVSSGWDGKGLCVIVTGASTGLGLETARVLALRGADVIMAGRDLAKLQKAEEKLHATHPNLSFKVMELDLASLASVHAFAQAFLKLNKPLNILMNNAGIMACPYGRSADGHELQFATNHLGHFLLTNLLLDNMIATARTQNVKGRIITTSSLAHVMPPYPGGLRPEAELDSETGYNRFKAYTQSKLCNILFARELDQRLKSVGANILSVSLHPGSIRTELERNIGLPPIVKNILALPLTPMFKSIPAGAATQVYCATAKDVVSGEYYTDCNIFPSASLSHDAELGARLWDLSLRLCSKYLPTGQSTQAASLTQGGKADGIKQ